MKQIVIMLACAFLGLSACSANGGDSDSAKKNEQAFDATQKKVLVAYFSASSGKVTKGAAEKIAEATKGDLFEIVPEQIYTEADLDWTDKQSRSSVEMHDLASRPAIKDGGKVPNLADYDVVFVGFPVWWDLAPTIVNTFIEANADQLKGKTIVPFATSGGSPITNSAKELKNKYPDLDWRAGKLLNRTSQADVAKWVKDL